VSTMTGLELKNISEGYKLTKIGLIPEDWDIVALGDYSKFVTSGSRGWARYYSGNGALFVRSQNVRGGRLDFTDRQFVSPPNGSEGSRTQVKHSDLLITITGNSVGNVALVEYELGEAYISQHVGLVRLKDTIYGQYICRFLSPGSPGNMQIWASQSGQSKPGLTLRILHDFRLALPPSKIELEKIVRALSDVDSLIVALESLIAKKSAIKTAAMQQILTGKKRLPGFAKKNSDATQASQTDQNTDSAINYNGQTAPRPGYKHTELGEIPEDWEVVSYEESFKFLPSASNSRSDLTENDELSYIHYGDIHTLWDIKLDFSKSSLPKISQEKVGGAVPIKDGDVIMADASEDYAGIGKSVEIQGLGDRKAISGLHTFLLRDKGYFVDGFRGYLHLIKAVKNNFDRLATGLKVYGLSKNSLKEVLLLVPPKEEQTAIANVLSDMDTELDALQQRLNKTQQIKQGMMQELLTGKTRLI